MSIPDPPRVTRWRAALAWQWPLGFGAGIVFVIFTVMMTVYWLSDYRDLPFDDMALDSGAKTFQAAGRRPKQLHQS